MHQTVTASIWVDLFLANLKWIGMNPEDTCAGIRGTEMTSKKVNKAF